MTGREEFLSRVQRETMKTTGLFPAVATERPADPAGAIAAIRERSWRELEALLARFQAEAERVGVGFSRAATIADAGAIVLSLATARHVRRVVTWGRRALGLTSAVAARLRQAEMEVLEASPEEIAPEARLRLRELLAGADLGLTGVDLAIAETGSLVLASGIGKGRGVSLLPPCHLALFGRDQLVAGLDEAGVILEAWHTAPTAGGGANIVFITGPSRTADIELTLTRGVHGPGEVHAVFVDSL
ncbi:MAG: LutC/YkgG family protein [Candidatus Rokuibacteriota bacterium]